MTVPGDSRGRSERAVVAALFTFGAVYTTLSVWMLFDPKSFYDVIGPYDAYNPHFTRDAGAFQGGIGVALLVSVRIPRLRPGAAVALLAATAWHLVSHFIDFDGAVGETAIDRVEALLLIPTTLVAAWLVKATLARGSDSQPATGA